MKPAGFDRLSETIPARWFPVGILGMVGLVYHTAGYYWLLIPDAGAWDLRLRWLEQQIVFAGANPYDVVAAVRGGQAVAPTLRPYAEGLLTLGYPPWSHFAGAVFLWPSWPATRILYAVLNLLATAVIVFEVYGRTRTAGTWTALVLATSALAMGSNYSTLIAGNYGILVVATLLASLRLQESGRTLLSGVLLGLALGKPSLSAPFLVPCLLKRRWTALGGCIGYVIIASAAVWWWTGVPTLTMLRQMFAYGETYVAEAYGPLNLLMYVGVPRRLALLATGVAGFGVAVGVTWRWRTRPMLFHFVVAAAVARLATYHKVHDNVLLVFLVLGVGAVLATRPSPGAWAILLALGVTLWLPGRLVAYPERYPLTIWMQAFHVVVWCASLVYLIRWWPSRRL